MTRAANHDTSAQSRFSSRAQPGRCRGGEIPMMAEASVSLICCPCASGSSVEQKRVEDMETRAAVFSAIVQIHIGPPFHLQRTLVRYYHEFYIIQTRRLSGYVL